MSVAVNFIGQTQLKNEVWDKSIPPFIIIEGPRGQGKKTFITSLAKSKKIPLIEIGNKIADIREMIETCQTLISPVMYFIPEGDGMSIGAKNSLLKITEEPPKNLIIVIAVTHRDNTLQTIRSRGRLWTMDNYTLAEKLQYLTNEYGADVPYEDDILAIANNLGEINELMKIGFGEFIAYVDKVVANILAVSTGNSFKIAEKIDFKNSGEGYDVSLFLKVCMKVLHDELLYNLGNSSSEDIKQTVTMMRETNRALSDLSLRGVNKKAVLDMWVLNIRRLR